MHLSCQIGLFSIIIEWCKNEASEVVIIAFLRSNSGGFLIIVHITQIVYKT